MTKLGRERSRRIGQRMAASTRPQAAISARQSRTDRQQAWARTQTLLMARTTKPPETT